MLRFGLEKYNILPFETNPRDLSDFDSLRRNPNSRDDDGNTGLHKIVLSYNDDPTLVEDLVRNGAELDIPNNSGKSPLLLAVVHRRRKLVEKFIEIGSNVNMRDNWGNNSLHYMALHRLNDCWKFIESDSVNDDDGGNENSSAPFSFDTTYLILETLLQNGARVNAPNNRFESPLMWAARGIYLDIVKTLLAHGARVNSINIRFETSLHWAANYNKGRTDDIELWEKLNCDIVVELVRNKANVNCLDRRGKTPLVNIRRSKRLNRKQCEHALLRTGALANWEHRIDFYLHKYRIIGRFREDMPLIKYINACYDEIDQMKLIQVSDRSNLCQYALEGKSEAEPSCVTKVSDKVLEILLHNSFPVYQDFILSRLPRSYIRKKMSESGMHTMGEDKEVSLNYDIIFKLSAFLDNSDLFNVFTIFNSLR